MRQDELDAASYSKTVLSTTKGSALRDSQAPYNWDSIRKHSSFKKALRITSYCLRFTVKGMAKFNVVKSRPLGFLQYDVKMSADQRQVAADEIKRSKFFQL